MPAGTILATICPSWKRVALRESSVRSESSVRNLVLLVGLVLSACSGRIGEHFADVDAIGVSETWQDWIVVGRFGPKGPFELVEIKEREASEPCSFSHEGQGHTYNKFHDFKLTVLRLEGPEGQVSHVVLRSEQKVYASA